MPKSQILIELDNPEDYFEILEGDKFKDSKVDMKVKGKTLQVKIVSKDPRALVATLGSVIKQVRIVNQTMDLVKNNTKTNG